MTESDLEQAHYRDLSQLRYEIRRFLRFSEEASRKAGLLPQQQQAMLAVIGMAPDRAPNVQALADRLQIRHHSAVELINRLVQRGLLQRARDPHDQRRVLITLTPRGEGVIRELSRV